MTVNWTAISTISELVGAVVVVVTHAMWPYRSGQSTHAILANSRQTLLDADLGLISDFIDHALDPHLIGDEVKLTPEDERRFTWLLVKGIRIREFAWHQYKSGNLDAKSWQSYMAPVASMFGTERAKAALNFYAGSPEFALVLTEWLRAAKREGGMTTLLMSQRARSRPLAVIKIVFSSSKLANVRCLASSGTSTVPTIASGGSLR